MQVQFLKKQTQCNNIFCAVLKLLQYIIHFRLFGLTISEQS